MKLTDFEKDILKAASKACNQEQTGTVSYRVVSRVEIEKPPVEAETEVPVIPWQDCAERTQMRLAASLTKMKVQRWLKTHLPGSYIPTRLSFIDDEVFLAMGAVVFSSDSFAQRADAQKCADEWRSKGINCYVQPTLPKAPHVFSYEVLRLMPEFKDFINVEPLRPDNLNERIPARIEDALPGLEKDNVSSARKVVDRAFRNLEKEALAVRVEGTHLFWTWDGLSLTHKGFQAVQAIQEAENAPKEEKPTYHYFLLKCPACGQIFFRTTETFRQDVVAEGSMFKILPKYGPDGHNWTFFGPDATYRNVACPDCANSYTLENGFLREDVLVEPEQLAA